MFFAKNLKFLRKRNDLSQQDLADSLSISRSSLNSYERGTQPPFDIQIALADHFKLSMDALIRYDLNALSEYQWSMLEKGMDVDITGRRLRLLTVSVGEDNQEKIEMVDKKARAGYANGYADPEFIAALPKFDLPFLPGGKTYRCFQVQGDSMPPLNDGDWVTASYVENWKDIKDGERYVVVTLNEGIVFKVAYNRINNNRSLTLVSTNTLYSPFEVTAEEIVEVWRFETANLL